MRRMPRVGRVVVLVFAMSLATCTTAGRGVGETVQVAFVADLSAPEALEHVLPARRGAELAFRIARITGATDVAIELVDVDPSTDAGALRDLEDDPTLVAAIVAPSIGAMPDATAVDLPVISLSGLDATPPPGTAWLRLVAPLEVVAEALAGSAPNPPSCVLSDASAPDPLGEQLAGRLGVQISTIDPATAAGVAERAGCGTVSWTGSLEGGVAAIGSLEGSEIAFAGGDRLLGPDFLDQAGPAGDGARSFCSCTGLSSSVDLDAQRFIQDYQARFGSAPGAYAVEGWDAANLLLRAFAEDGPTRNAVRDLLGRVALVDGLVRSYRVGLDGELVDPDEYVVTYLALGGRWTEAVTRSG